MALCRDCKHYDLEAFRLSNGKLRIVKSNTARRLVDTAPILRKIPLSCDGRSYGRTRGLADFGLVPGRMEPNAGNGCPQWAKRDEVKA